MSVPYLQACDQPPYEVREAKKAMHDEFFSKARITGAVGIMYYPYQDGHFPTPGAGIEIEGRCYEHKFECIPREVCPLNKRILINRKENQPPGRPFVRYGIAVTPKQLREMKPRGSVTCMHGAHRTLNTVTNFSIPFPISLLPTASALYLYQAKLDGNRNITSITWESGNRSPVRLTVETIVGFATELLMAGVTVVIISHIAMNILL